MWDDYNKDLLRRRFTTSEIADEYAASAGVFFIGGQVSLQKDLKEFRDDFRSKLRRLKSVKERIPLFDEGSHAQEPGRGRVAGRGDRDDACLAIQLRAHRVSGGAADPPCGGSSRLRRPPLAAGTPALLGLAGSSARGRLRIIADLASARSRRFEHRGRAVRPGPPFAHT